MQTRSWRRPHLISHRSPQRNRFVWKHVVAVFDNPAFPKARVWLAQSSLTPGRATNFLRRSPSIVDRSINASDTIN
jgi:hypothetical protein